MPKTKTKAKAKDFTLGTPEDKPDEAKEDAVMEALGESPESKAGRQLQRLEAPADVISLLTPDAMKQQMIVETKKREIITQFINHHMVEGIDHGKIHIAKNCQNRYGCKIASHLSKNTLFKAGAEKFCSLFRLRAEFEKDDQTWEMMGRKNGLICLVCRLYTPSGVLAGEGRGAADIIEKQGSANTAIKIAEKRAKLDAVLATGGLSDFFSQDLEDIAAVDEVVAEEENHDADRKKIAAHLKELGVDYKNAEIAKAMIKSITQLEPEEANFPDIEGRLAVRVQEQREAKAEAERLKNSNAAPVQ